jgi:hypothetical protein
MYIYIKPCANYKKFSWMNSDGEMDKYANCILKTKGYISTQAVTPKDNKRDLWYWWAESFIVLNTYKLLKQFRKRCVAVYK